MASVSRITTIIPTYRRPHLLKRAIASALHQTIADIQICVYDNNSADETKQVVEQIAKIDSRVKYFCHAETIDAPDNFTYGLSQVNTPFFSILADDDLLAPTFYETALQTFDRYPKAKTILGSTIDCSPTGKVISAEATRWHQEYFEPPLGVLEVIQKYFNWTGALFRTEILDCIQIDPTVKPIDYDFILRLTAKFPFAISKAPCALFIIHPQSYSSFSGLKLFWPSWQKIMLNLKEALSQAPDIDRQAQDLLRKKLMNNLYHLSIHQMAQKKFDAADGTLEIYEEQFAGDKKGQILKTLSGFFRKFPHLTALVRFALKIVRYRRIKTKLKYRKFARNLIRRYQKCSDFLIYG